jgi:DNA repair photolyase
MAMAVGTTFDLWAKPAPSVRIRQNSSPSATRLRSAMMIACYHPGDSTLTRQSFELQIEHGLPICALTKGGTRSLRDLDLFRPNRDAFASTLTSLNDRFSQKVGKRRGRIAALKRFHGRGIFTWVRLEPTIDVEASPAIVDATYSFVHLYKVGRVNYLPITKTTSWQEYTLRMIDKLNTLGNLHYIKQDLQPFLRAGYHNPLRVPQHH